MPKLPDAVAMVGIAGMVLLAGLWVARRAQAASSGAAGQDPRFPSWTPTSGYWGGAEAAKAASSVEYSNPAPGVFYGG